MNIFVLDYDIDKAVLSLCDKHVGKMTLETAQMLCSPFIPGLAPYKRSHFNHPCSVWVRTSSENYRWLLQYGERISQEYTARYHKIHKSYSVIKWCQQNYHQLNLPEIGLTKFALAMPDKYKVDCAVESYRNYYKGDKAYMAKWKFTGEPDWWK